MAVFSTYFTVGYHENINQIEEVILTETEAYALFPIHYGNLHSYVRAKKRLREPVAGSLFRQIMSCVAYLHERGIVLRDLKLRKFAFKNPEK